MSEFEVINEVSQWANDGVGRVDIIHERDAKKDLSIIQSNYNLSNEEIVSIYAYCQEHSIYHVSAYSGKNGAEIGFSKNNDGTKVTIKIDDLPKKSVAGLSEALAKEDKISLSWVADLKRAARDGEYVRIRKPLLPESRLQYADLFEKNFENWAKQSRTQKMTLGRYDYNSICYVGPNDKLELNRYGMEGNGIYNPLLKGQVVASGSAKSDFAERLTEVLKEGNLEYVEIAPRFECNGVMVCTFSERERAKMLEALPNSFSQKEIGKYNTEFCFLNFKDFDFGKTDEEKFEAFNTAWRYNRPDVAAQIIKENPHLLESDMMRKVLSPYDKLNPHHHTGAYAFEHALEMVGNLKYLLNKKVISEEQFNKAVNTQSPDIGETFLTHAVKLAVQEASKSPYYGSNYLEVIDRALSVGLDCNVPNARGQYPLELIKEVDIAAHRTGLATIKNPITTAEFDQKPTFEKVLNKIDKLTNPVTKVRIDKMPPKMQVDIVEDRKAPKINAHVTSYDIGDVIKDKSYYSEAPVWMAKVERPSYLASDIEKPTDIAWVLPKGEYVVASQSFDHISSMEEFKEGKKTFYTTHKDGTARKVSPDQIVSTIFDIREKTGHSNIL